MIELEYKELSGKTISTPYRDYSISLIRAFAAISIVLCHIFQYYDICLAWWFNVGVEVFLVISGFLYGKKEIDDSVSFMWKNIKKILIPCILWMGIAIVLYRIFARDQVSVFDIVYPLVYGSTLPGLSHLWFVPYILFCYILTPFFCRLKKRMNTHKLRWIIGTIAVVFAISYQRYEFPRIVCYIVGYFIGDAFRDGKYFSAKLTAFFSVTALLMNAVRIYFTYIVSKEALGIFQSFFMMFESFSHTMLGIAIFLLLYAFFSKIKIKANPFLSFMDKYAYEIYLTHHIFILSAISVLSLTEFNWLNIILSLVLTLISAIILKFITNQVMKIINCRMVEL